jgi:peptidoglycan/LPS O-acetylase OafA/YrhL
MSQRLSSLIGNMAFLQPFRVTVYGGNSPLWSLSYEFWYYIIFYFAVLSVATLRTRKISKFLIPLLVLSLFGCSMLSYEWFALGFIWVSGSVCYIALIGFEKKYQISNWIFFRRSKFLKLSIVFVLPSLLILRFGPRYLYSFPIIIIFLIISIAFTDNSTYIGPEKWSYRLIAQGSKCSFSLYLIHFPLLAFISSYFTPYLRWNFNLLSFFSIVVSVCLTLIAAYFFAFFTEFRLDLLRKRLNFVYRQVK